MRAQANATSSFLSNAFSVFVEYLPNIASVSVSVVVRNPPSSAASQGKPLFAHFSSSSRQLLYAPSLADPEARVSLLSFHPAFLVDPSSLQLSATWTVPASSSLATTVKDEAARKVYPGLEMKLRVSKRPSESVESSIRLLSAKDIENVCAIVCGTCGAQITRNEHGDVGISNPPSDPPQPPNDRLFTSVLSLPSPYWHELIDAWMCHNENFNRDGKLDTARKVFGKPEPGVCLVSDDAVALNGVELDWESIAEIDFMEPTNSAKLAEVGKSQNDVDDDLACPSRI
ncbi:hypothetical protein HDU93_002251 [Gonapodya sp. JEL0774]|nr:hypothetical protein HDU93_002251 [Gonapodya sp. JEL0774]